MKCPNCGRTEHEEDANFCESCGSKLKEVCNYCWVRNTKYNCHKSKCPDDFVRYGKLLRAIDAAIEDLYKEIKSQAEDRIGEKGDMEEKHKIIQCQKEIIAEIEDSLWYLNIKGSEFALYIKKRLLDIAKEKGAVGK